MLGACVRAAARRCVIRASFGQRLRRRPALASAGRRQHADRVPASRCSLGLLGLLLPGCADGGADFTAGVRTWRAGQTKEAVVALAAAERAYGAAAPPELLHDLALARLATGDLRGAEIAAEKASATGPAGFAALRDFVLGSAAFVRCARAEAQASGPEAEPFAFEVAIGYAMAAQSAWQRAAASRDDWPEARRNVERAQQKIAELRDKKTQAQKRKDRADQQKAQQQRRDDKKPER